MKKRVSTLSALVLAVFMLTVVAPQNIFAAEEGSSTEPRDGKDTHVATSSNASNIYVDSVNGNDNNNGTIGHPVKTLVKGQALARDAVNNAGDVTVYIKGGVYTLEEALEFDGDLDSHPNGNTVTYKNYNDEKVYISGGTAVDRWTQTETELDPEPFEKIDVTSDIRYIQEPTGFILWSGQGYKYDHYTLENGTYTASLNGPPSNPGVGRGEILRTDSAKLPMTYGPTAGEKYTISFNWKIQGSGNINFRIFSNSVGGNGRVYSTSLSGASGTYSQTMDFTGPINDPAGVLRDGDSMFLFFDGSSGITKVEISNLIVKNENHADTGNPTAGKILKASVPDGLIAHDLYVNGKPAVRAKTDGSMPVTWGGGPTVVYRDDGKLAMSANVSNIEIVFRYLWNTHRCTVASAQVSGDGKSSVLTLDPAAYATILNTPYRPTGVSHIWRMENAIEFLDKPGEWFYDETENVIYYMPREGETKDNITVYAGALEELITSTKDATLRNITFEGLTFCNTTWLRPAKPGGYITRQGGFYLPPNYRSDDINQWIRPEAAITLFKTNGVKFINNEFINLGNSGIDMEQAKNALISGNLFTDCGGSAIIMAGFTPNTYHSPTDVSVITENCEISNNYIHDICTNMLSSCGVAIGYGRNINFINNTMHDLPYTGLSYGWGWGNKDFDAEPISTGGRIAGNNIYHTVKSIEDGGAIYTLSSRQGLVIEDNYVHDNGLWFGGIYLDNRSGGYTVRNNVVANCPSNLCFTSYDTRAYNNYLDNYSQSTWGNSNAKVVFVSFYWDANTMTADTDCSQFGIVAYNNWVQLNNEYTRPAGNHTSAEAKAIIAVSGVKPQYRTRFELAEP